jgi:hypothetical protein
MKIFELVKPPSTAAMAPGTTIGPVGPGVRPTGEITTAPTEQKPQTSNTPKTAQPTGFDPNNNTPPNAQTTTVGEPMGQEPEQTPPAGGPQPVAPGATAQAGQQPVTVQDLSNQMQAVIRRLTAIQNQEPNPPSTAKSQPGVSGVDQPEGSIV